MPDNGKAQLTEGMLGRALWAHPKAKSMLITWARAPSAKHTSKTVAEAHSHLLLALSYPSIAFDCTIATSSHLWAERDRQDQPVRQGMGRPAEPSCMEAAIARSC